MRLTGKTACQPQYLSVFLVVNVEILYIVNVFNFVFVDKFYLILSFNTQFFRQCIEVFVAVDERVFGRYGL